MATQTLNCGNIYTVSWNSGTCTDKSVKTVDYFVNVEKKAGCPLLK